jgi:predicted ATPase
LVDNFEHVIEAAPFLGVLLESSAALKVLVTSRAALHVYGEHERTVPPLCAPDPRNLPPLGELGQNPAIALFVKRAAAVNSDFALNEQNVGAVAELCSRLDGLPLAIELAAVQTKVLSPAAMLDRFGRALDLLTGGPRDVPERQRTLRNTIDWSYHLLNPTGQKLFRRMAVFAGGCTLESAEAVCNTRMDLDADVLGGVSSLVDYNLVQRTEGGNGQARFLMLETLREYGWERLAESAEVESTRLAHAAYCMVLAEECAVALDEKQQADWLDLCDAEHGNLRAALAWLIETGKSEWALRMATALYSFWERRDHLAEGRDMLEAVLCLPGAASPTRQRATAFRYAGNLANTQGDFDAALRLHQRGLEIAIELGTPQQIAAGLSGVAFNLRWTGDVAAARHSFEKCVSVCRESGDRRALAAAVSNFGDLLLELGDLSRARSMFQEALSIFNEIGDASGSSWSLSHLGDVARDEGQFVEAARLYGQSAEIFRRVGDRWGLARTFVDLASLAGEQVEPGSAHLLLTEALEIFLDLNHSRGIAKVLEVFAYLAVVQHRFEHSLLLAGAAEALRVRVGAPERPVEREQFERMLESAWRAVAPGTAKALWTEAGRMPLDEVIQRAREQV